MRETDIEEIDTAKPGVTAVQETDPAPEPDADEDGPVDPNLIEFDVEFMHERRSGVETVFATGKLDAAGKLIEMLRKQYPGTEDAQVITVDTD